MLDDAWRPSVQSCRTTLTRTCGYLHNHVLSGCPRRRDGRWPGCLGCFGRSRCNTPTFGSGTRKTLDKSWKEYRDTPAPQGTDSYCLVQQGIWFVIEGSFYKNVKCTQRHQTLTADFCGVLLEVRSGAGALCRSWIRPELEKKEGRSGKQK